MEDQHDSDGFRGVSFQVGVDAAWSTLRSSRQSDGMTEWQDPDVSGDVTFQEYVDREGEVEVRWLSDQHFGFTSLDMCPKWAETTRSRGGAQACPSGTSTSLRCAAWHGGWFSMGGLPRLPHEGVPRLGRVQPGGGPWRATTLGCKGWDSGRVLPVEDGQVDATGPGGKVRKHSWLPPHLPAREGPLGKPPWLSDDSWRFRR